MVLPTPGTSSSRTCPRAEDGGDDVFDDVVVADDYARDVRLDVGTQSFDRRNSEGVAVDRRLGACVYCRVCISHSVEGVRGDPDDPVITTTSVAPEHMLCVT